MTFTTTRRPLPLRMRFAFIHTYEPGIDDAPYRAPAAGPGVRRIGLRCGRGVYVA